MAGQIVKAKVAKDFVQLKNKVAQDINLSWQALGLLTYIQSLPDNWVIWKTKLYELRGKNGRTSTEAAFKELEDAGYILSVEKRDATTGHFQGYDYIVYPEITVVENQQSIVENQQPDVDYPQSGFPQSGNQQLQRHSNTTKTERDKAPILKKFFLDIPSESEVEEFFLKNNQSLTQSGIYYGKRRGVGWRFIEDWRSDARAWILSNKERNGTQEKIYSLAPRNLKHG